MAKRSNEGLVKQLYRQIGRLSFNRCDRLGKGSFGNVFRGKLTNQETRELETVDVAIKRIEMVDVNEIEKVIFENIEPHPNVLHCYCTEKDDDFLYIATELCAGTLEDIIKRDYKGPPVGSHREMMRQVAQGLEHLHKSNIVHRDIKPTNILVSFSDPKTMKPQMKLADFGFCRVLKTDGKEISLSKCGTRGWMAPEMYSNVPIHEKDAFAVDIFSLGCVFGYVLSKGNQHPFGTTNLRDFRIENNEDMILSLHDIDHYGPILFELIRAMLLPQYSARLVIQQVLEHAFFVEGIDNKGSVDWITLKRYEEEFLSSLNQLAITGSYYNSSGRTPLMFLCRNNVAPGDGNLLSEIEKFVHLDNVDAQVLNAKDNDGNSAISLLCEHYSGGDLIDIIRLFIEKGVDLKVAITKNGFTVLMLLCMQYGGDNLVEIVRLLIENGVNINATSIDGWNALHVVCRYYNNDKLIDVIALLIGKGIDLNATATKESWNAITLLSLYYNGGRMLDILRLLIDNGIDVTAKARNGFNALGCVCCLYSRNDLIHIIRMIIAKDFRVIECVGQRDGSNPLLMVCLTYARNGGANLINIIRLLVENGIDVNYQKWDGWNALMSVCRYNSGAELIEIVQLLVSYGAEINLKTKNGSNALLLLCGNQHLHHKMCFDLFRLLIVDLKADVKAVYDFDSDNVLTTLCKQHHCCEKLVDIIRLILDHSSIDVNHKNKNGEDAVSILRNKRFPRDVEPCIQLLVKRGAV